MAVRSGAGTGVIVSLVVFILTTIFMLILAIVFYAGKTDAIEQRGAAEKALSTYATAAERSTDRFRDLERDAAARNKSVGRYLSDQYEDTMRYVMGDGSAQLEAAKKDLLSYGVPEAGVVRQTVDQMHRDLGRRQDEVDGLNAKLAGRDAELAERQAEIDRMKKDHAAELEQVSKEIVAYRQAGEQYQSQVVQAIEDMNGRVQRLEDDHKAEVERLEEERDTVNRELVLARARVDEYEAIFEKIRTKATDPSQLVDGSVIDVDPTNDQVYIDRGKKDRIVRGMTFEIYDDAGAIQVDPRTGVLPRGKASIQVLKVAEGTSTCKITRAVAGRPVVRNNVIANAIYDPKYRFKFLVHGKFDVDQDGRPSEAEAEYLRSLIVDWGGEVVHGEELPGDLDFLLLGEKPDMPPALPADATEAQIRIYMQKRDAVLQYERLFELASKAQIPVLNANRFFILIGR